MHWPCSVTQRSFQFQFHCSQNGVSHLFGSKKERLVCFLPSIVQKVFCVFCLLSRFDGVFWFCFFCFVLFFWGGFFCSSGGWTQWSPEVPYNPYSSVALRWRMKNRTEALEKYDKLSCFLLLLTSIQLSPAHCISTTEGNVRAFSAMLTFAWKGTVKWKLST